MLGNRWWHTFNLLYFIAMIKRNLTTRVALVATAGLFGLATPLSAASTGSTNEPPISNQWIRVESYDYTTFDEDNPAQILERVTMQFRTGAHEQQTAYTSQNPEGSEQVLIRLTPEGALLSGTRKGCDTNGTPIASARIWIEDNQIISEASRGNGTAKRKSSPRNDLDVAAEPSLMNILRTFPFDSGEERHLLMATFSQYVLPMTIRQVDDECISVPAGIYDCFKLEAIVRFFGLRFTTTYWVTRAPPHYLVRYRGKRGLFLTPTYVTELVSVQTPDAPPAER